MCASHQPIYRFIQTAVCNNDPKEWSVSRTAKFVTVDEFCSSPKIGQLA